MWPFKTKEQKDLERYDDGYEWAAARLLKGKTIEEVEAHVECSIHFDDYDEFDRGVENAVRDFEKRLKENQKEK